MINRKGEIFDQKKFTKYAEIENLDHSFDELRINHFIREPAEADKKSLTFFLTKPPLIKWCSLNEVGLSKSASRDELVISAQLHLNQLKIGNLPVKNLVVQQKTEELEYILFLFFGSIQKTLTLYTLRDLGIRQSETLKTNFVPRFKSTKEVQEEYFFIKALNMP